MRLYITVCLVIILGLFYPKKYKSDLSRYYNTNMAYEKLGPDNYQIWFYLDKYSQLYNVPLRYVLKCINIESSYSLNNYCYSSKNIIGNIGCVSYGVMQIKFSTAQMMSKEKISREQLLNNIETNIRLSIKYLAASKLEGIFAPSHTAITPFLTKILASSKSNSF